MNHRYEIRISGTGGQGVVLAGIIIAEAASLCKGQYVVQTVSYGPQVRGGMSSAEVVISRSPIDYPKPLKLDIMVPMTQEACNEARDMMKEDGLILLDPLLVRQKPEGWVATVPLVEIAVDATGRRQMANIVAVGAISRISPYLDPSFTEQAVKGRSPKGLEEAFLKAFWAGVEAVRGIRAKVVYERSPSPED